MTISAPPVPNRDTGLEDTKRYLDHLRVQRETVTVRSLIGYWGYKGRGKNAVAIVNDDLARMQLAVEPPLDSVPLDFEVSIVGHQAAAWTQAAEDQPADHLLPLSRIDSATHALRADQPEEEQGYVTRDTPVADASTVMMRHDYSQLPVVESADQHTVVGVFSWESYAQATLRGARPIVVADALLPASTVDLHSDLFANVAPVADNGFVIVTYRGVLAGIVTASDLTLEFEDLSLPFLAVGRCERELKRVAASAFTEELKMERKQLDEMTFGNLQHLYQSAWDRLGWSLSKDLFVQWLDSTRRLRNEIAHFDDRDLDRTADIDAVHRLTRWLSGIKTPSALEHDIEAKTSGG